MFDLIFLGWGCSHDVAWVAADSFRRKVALFGSAQCDVTFHLICRKQTVCVGRVRGSAFRSGHQLVLPFLFRTWRVPKVSDMAQIEACQGE